MINNDQHLSFTVQRKKCALPQSQPTDATNSIMLWQDDLSCRFIKNKGNLRGSVPPKPANHVPIKTPPTSGLNKRDICVFVPQTSCSMQLGNLLSASSMHRFFLRQQNIIDLYLAQKISGDTYGKYSFSFAGFSPERNIHAYIYIHIYVFIYIYICIYIFFIFLHINIHIYTYNICMYINVYMHICTCVCLCDMCLYMKCVYTCICSKYKYML